MQTDRFDTKVRRLGVETSRRGAFTCLPSFALSLMGGLQFAEAARDPQGKCTKIRNKKRRRQCLKKAQAHDGQDASQLSPLIPSGSNVTFPVRAAFYYPWVPNAWKQCEIFPFTNYMPSLGYYNSGDPNTILQHIQAMQYGGIQVGITSWWGVADHTDQLIPAHLLAAASTGFRWALYYEQEGTTNPSVEQIRADLTSIRDRYAGDTSYARVDGRFVGFVYNADDRDCAVADRWHEANTVGAYIVLKVFRGYGTCLTQPDSWHQYAPAVAADDQTGYSYSISPGFWKRGEEARLQRNLVRWEQNIRDMVGSGEPWQLVSTFNEWGEGTEVESAVEWESASGFGAYLDALHRNGVP